MVEKCANPNCSARFRSLRDGRLFVIESADAPCGDAGGRSRKLHYLWLCGCCCQTMTVLVEKGKGVKVVPLPPSATDVRAAS